MIIRKTFYRCDWCATERMVFDEMPETWLSLRPGLHICSICNTLCEEAVNAVRAERAKLRPKEEP